MSKTRTEKDSLGKLQLPADAYFGVNAARAQENFQISGQSAPQFFIKALGMVKLAAAETNSSLKLIDKKVQKPLVKACKEFLAGNFTSQFTVDVYQAGAGTSYNMNANEIIANRANELLKKPKGSYAPLHPNNHVNMGQSTNDVIPTASRLAVLLALPDLLAQLKGTINALSTISKKYSKLEKVGRTHLQDAVPITLGQEFDSYKEALEKSRDEIEHQAKNLTVLGIGGTAVGTGLNAHPKYRTMMVKNLSKQLGKKLSSAKNLTEIANNMNAFMNFSAALRSLATNLLNLCLDLKLMGSGPKAGLAELTLPPVQAGSSIMPGKINPSIPEAVEMVALQVLGNDQTIALACQRSNFELNVYCPLIMLNLLHSMQILTGGLKTLTIKCLKGLQVNVDHIQKTFDNSLATATALAPKLGYDLTADIVKSALKHGRTIKEELKKRQIKA